MNLGFHTFGCKAKGRHRRRGRLRASAGPVERLTEDDLRVYLESDRWDGAPRVDIVID